MSTGTITQLLQHFDPNDATATDRLWRAMYDELHRLAHRELRRWRPGQTLNTTALVHECFIKLRAAESLDWQSKAHFYRGARQAMRQLVIDFARRRSRKKRGGDAPHISIEDATLILPAQEQAEELLQFDEALERFGAIGEREERGRQAVEYVFYVGLTHKEAAEMLGVATKTVQRDIEFFKAWYAQHYTAA